MIVNENINVSYCRDFGTNFFFHKNDQIRNNHTINNVVVDCWDLEATKKVFSVEHKMFNNYYYELVYGENQHKLSFTNVVNDKDTSKNIIYYVVFEDIPFEVSNNKGSIYNGNVTVEFIEEVVSHIKEVLNYYVNANIMICSNILKYRTEKGIEEDLLMKSIVELNNERLTYDPEYDMRNLNSDEVLCVVSNQISYLFAHCNSINIPIICKKNKEEKFAVYDDYVDNKFNNITDEQLRIYTNNEFNEFLVDMDVNVYVINPMYYTEKSRIEKLITQGKDVKRQFNNVYFHGEANIVKHLFDTIENKEFINIVPAEKVNEDTLIITLNNKTKYCDTLRKNRDEYYNWLGLDFDIVKDNAQENTMRYYIQSFNNSKPMYSFETIEELRSHFNIQEVKNIDLNTQGKILLCLDYPIGMNYDSLNKWFKYWNDIIQKVKSKFTNPIIVKTYFDDRERKAQTKNIYEKFFSIDDKITYDDSSETFIEYIQRDDIYFCIKCQGALFLKCLLHGRILLSGLPEKDRVDKPDKIFVSTIERSLDDIVNDTTNLENIMNEYNNNQLDILKTTTGNLTTLDDIKNGTFVKKILLT